MWSNSKLNSFTKSFTTSSGSGASGNTAAGNALRKTANSSLAKTISNNFTSLSNYSLSLATGTSNNSASSKNSNSNNNNTNQPADNYRVNDYNASNSLSEERSNVIKIDVKCCN